jgi:glycosyltransferase involved in cell wall biosynthesis
MRKTSRERIVENYTWEKITQQYISLFNKMLND